MGVILVVDDEQSVERLITQRFRAEIREGEFRFVFARDGQDALDRLKENPQIDCVITDINMPRMDGLTLLDHVREVSPLAKTIIISAYGDMQNIRTAMNRGAFDFLTKPLDFADLRLTMRKTLVAVQALKESFRQVEENEVLKMYVNPAVFRALKAPLPKEQARIRVQRVEATVGFIDICGFTQLSEQLDVGVLRDLVNLYFDIIAQETLSFGGTIDKYIGDAAMVVFEGADQLARACRAVLAILSRIQPLLAQEIAPGHPYPHLSAGLNRGEMISGDFGSRTIKRFDFTVIGDAVNTAARIESLAAPGQILIPSRWADVLKPDFELQELGAFKLYNKKDPITVVGIAGAKLPGAH